VLDQVAIRSSARVTAVWPQTKRPSPLYRCPVPGLPHTRKPSDIASLREMLAHEHGLVLGDLAELLSRVSAMRA